MNDWTDRLLTIDFGELFPFLADIIRNPASNLLAFVLMLGAITIVMLLIITVLLMFFLGGEEEEDSADTDEAPLRTAATPARPVRAARTTVVRERAKRPLTLAGTLVWLLIVVAIWVAGGWVSSSNTVCVSCHLDDSIHTARIEGTGTDPHDPVACVSCHEGNSAVARVTTAVPARAIHFVTGMVLEKQAARYGVPVNNKDCLACHERDIEGTVVNEDRGVRTSHLEPLDAGALCRDCHVPLADSGVISRYTVGMEPCVRCHDAKRAPAECDYCHTKDVAFAVQIRTATEPRDHVATLDCGGCHDLDTCDACHGTRLPHSQTFLSGGHAREAVEDIWFNDGEVCSRCHLDSRRPCSKCHADGGFPQHALNFATDHQSTPPNNNGCNSCHGGLAWDANRNFCALCHDRYGLGFETTGGL